AVSPPGRIGPIRSAPPGEERRDPCLFGLAPCGVYPATTITGRAVRSYRTFSPLPSSLARGWRYVLCCTSRPEVLKPPSRTLSGTLPCGVRTFLPRSTPCGPSGSDHPAACNPECTAHGGELTALRHRIRQHVPSRFALDGLLVSSEPPERKSMEFKEAVKIA